MVIPHFVALLHAHVVAPHPNVCILQDNEAESDPNNPTVVADMEHDEHEGLDEASLKEHEEVTKVKVTTDLHAWLLRGDSRYTAAPSCVNDTVALIAMLCKLSAVAVAVAVALTRFPYDVSAVW